MKPFFSPRFNPRHYAGGFIVSALLTLIYGAALYNVFSVGEAVSWSDLWHDNYVRHVILFSFGQAFLSALLSVCLGMLLARALFYQAFWAKAFLLRIFSLTFVLPSLVAVFGLLGMYGSAGWIAQLANWLGMDWRPDIYGLTGILMTHLFFNMPLAARLFLQSLGAIPNQQRQLAAQLNINGWQFLRLLEWPYLRSQLLSVFTLIFMLCFTSFTIVLTLGGGPQYATLEVAIYQAVTFDFDLSAAAFFTLLQLAFCALLFGLGSLLDNRTEVASNNGSNWRAAQSSAVRIQQVLVIILCGLFILLPLLHIVISALRSDQLLPIWQSPQLWRAIGYSCTIAPLSAVISLLISIALLLSVRRLHWSYRTKTANLLMNASLLILAIPTLILAIGLFLWLRVFDFGTAQLFFIVVLCNALAAMPFVTKSLYSVMNNNMIYYEKLCQSLGVTGWNRWSLIEWHNLAPAVKYAFALACALSFGDFTTIALFGNQHFTSLPHLLYQQLGSYRGDQAAVTALILLVGCLLVFRLAEANKRE